MMVGPRVVVLKRPYEVCEQLSACVCLVVFKARTRNHVWTSRSTIGWANL